MNVKEEEKLNDGDQCTVVAGTHAGKSGIVKDINKSKTGHITITGSGGSGNGKGLMTRIF
jgi:ribosomal protein L24